MPLVANLMLDTTTAGIQFLRTELTAGLTFSRIALHAKHAAKIDRNRVNARKAYDALLHFTLETGVPAKDVKDLQTKMAQLKADLQKLGEDV